ncbi:phosphomannose isomerase type II C-terminal cupin domain [Patescibacteria group bacterium]|nr:phosphomannose isomerase type II C-terminal cupin domain [Patescibacteria group bacterium]
MKPTIEHRPWGSFTTFTKNETSTVKILNIKKGEELSLQYHNNREEFWKVLDGTPMVTIGDEVKSLKEGEEVTVKSNTKHRISAPNDDVRMLEISTGNFDEEDIVRVEDKYNRI